MNRQSKNLTLTRNATATIAKIVSFRFQVLVSVFSYVSLVEMLALLLPEFFVFYAKKKRKKLNFFSVSKVFSMNRLRLVANLAKLNNK